MSSTKVNVVESEQGESEVEAPEEEAAEETQAEGEQPAEDADDEQEQGQQGEDHADLPDWARKSLKKANDEAARFRTQLRDLQLKFEGAKTPEEFATATQELAAANGNLERELAVERALRKYGLEDEKATLFAKVPVDAIDDIAKALGASSQAPRDLRGGLDPANEDDTPSTPGELAKKYSRRY